jgi:hypothetical protein
MSLLEKFIVSVAAAPTAVKPVRQRLDYVAPRLMFVVQDWQYVLTAVLAVIATGVRILMHYV